MESQSQVSMRKTHDVIVIRRRVRWLCRGTTARDAGADVAIVDQGPLGGLCILRGCMPTKAILRCAEVAALFKRAEEFGLSPVSAQADLSAIVDRKDRLVREFADYRIQQLRDPRLTLYRIAGGLSVGPRDHRRRHRLVGRLVHPGHRIEPL